MAKEKKRSAFSVLKIILVIFGIILIPIVMDQMDFSEADVAVAGRICAIIAGGFTVMGIFARLLKVFAVIVISLIVLMVLVTEKIIEAPRLMELISG